MSAFQLPSPHGKKGKTISLKARALRYLSAREHSRAELAQKLGRYAGEGDDVEALLDELEAAKYLSNERFSESLIHRRASRFGNNRILYELQEHGIAGETLANVKAQLQEDETERAVDVLCRKFNVAPTDANEKIKQMRFLQQRGFSHAAIQAAVRARKHRGKRLGLENGLTGKYVHLPVKTGFRLARNDATPSR